MSGVGPAPLSSVSFARETIRPWELSAQRQRSPFAVSASAAPSLGAQYTIDCRGSEKYAPACMTSLQGQHTQRVRLRHEFCESSRICCLGCARHCQCQSIPANLTHLRVLWNHWCFICQRMRCEELLQLSGSCIGACDRHAINRNCHL